MPTVLTAMALLVALAPLTARAAERDILEAARDHPISTTVELQQLSFGNLALDRAELWLRDYLPRPWTATRIHALFQAAYSRLAKARKPTNASRQDQVADAWDEWNELTEQLGTILAASRDPRAALALGRVLESSDNRALTCSLSRIFLAYFLSDASYQHLPARESRYFVSGGCGDHPEEAHKWRLLNQHEVEQRAAAVTAGLPPCSACEKEALAAIDQLRRRLHDSAPTLRLTIKGGGMPRFVQVKYAVLTASTQGGPKGEWESKPFTSRDMRVRIPSNVLGRGDLRLSGLVMSPGYRTVLFELDYINDARVVPITLVPIPSKTLTGTVMFSNDSAPRRFGLRASLSSSGANDPPDAGSIVTIPSLQASNGWMPPLISNVNDPSGVFSHETIDLRNIAEAKVDRHGHFSITVPDVTQDPLLNAPGNRYEIRARDGNWVLLPDRYFIALDDPPGTALNIIAAPRPGSPASTNTNPGP